MEATMKWISAMLLVYAAVIVEETAAELEYCTDRLEKANI